ncbi:MULTISPECIES: methylglyoxal synthase [Luteimonas]|uniref:methylglyoxal synthase n=1 Tax=Luteimonas TaxID=83614 RepID=UPI000C7B1914|nr:MULTISPECIES: methylglyoxal synthase [Luteimonas]
MRLGLAANRRHHADADAALFRWLRASGAGLRELGVDLHAVGRTYDAIVRREALAGHAGLRRYPYGREGGLMTLVAEIVGLGPGRTLDGVVYLIDPVDPSSIFPEAVALKRQCVIQGKPFLSTVASARDFIESERLHAGLDADPGADDLHAFGGQTLALIAHDAMKPRMVEFVAGHFDLLSRFGERVATGTTGQLLNDLAWQRGWPLDRAWTRRFQSGPLGGAVFFEDPHVARQHEADIQLLERAVTTVTDTVACLTSPPVAERWAQAATRRAGAA